MPIVSLTGYWITYEISLWLCLWNNFLIELFEVRSPGLPIIHTTIMLRYGMHEEEVSWTIPFSALCFLTADEPNPAASGPALMSPKRTQVFSLWAKIKGKNNEYNQYGEVLYFLKRCIYFTYVCFVFMSPCSTFMKEPEKFVEASVPSVTGCCKLHYKPSSFAKSVSALSCWTTSPLQVR